MRKSTKLAILVAALVALCSIAALAADTWKQDGDNWYCYDKDGNMVYGEAKKSGSNYYYLDAATGAMVKNTLVDNGEGKFYYGEDGARVVGAWAKVAVENDGDGWEYMYFRPVTGKAYTSADLVDSKYKTINGKKYMFNSDGYMLYGYLDSNLNTADNVSDAAYNLGDKTDGSAQTGWVNVKDGADANFPDDASIWFYFKTGEKIVGKEQYKVASGKKYNFANVTGKMVTGWAKVLTASKVASEATYFGAADEGVKVTKTWIKTDHFAGEDKNKWYYLTSTGVAQGFGVTKINGKYYLFNADRQMVSGVVAVKASDELDPKSVTEIVKSSWADLDTFKKYPYTAGVKIMYFSGDADTDGSLKTGTQTVTIEGDSATVVFDKHGFALEGVSSKKIYKNGILQSAGDSKVAVKELRVTSADYYVRYYLVNAAGSILKNTKQMDADGFYWVAKGEYANTATAPADYKIYKFVDKEYASNAATALLKATTLPITFKVGTTTYTVDASAAPVDGVITVNWSKN